MYGAPILQVTVFSEPQREWVPIHDGSIVMSGFSRSANLYTAGMPTGLKRYQQNRDAHFVTILCCDQREPLLA